MTTSRKPAKHSSGESGNRMAENLILRNESDLPGDVRALLHAPPPDGVWHLPSHPRIGNSFRAAAAVALVVLLGMLAFFAMVNVDAWRHGNLRSEGFLITLGMVLLPAGLWWLCRRAKVKAEKLEADLQAGRVRFGLWLTREHVLVRDCEGIACARRDDIAKTHTYHAGGGRPDLLVLTLTNRQTIYISAPALDGWRGRADRLRDEFEKHLTVNPGITAEEMQRIADLHLPKTKFCEFIRWLDGEALRLKSDPAEKAALLAMADAALAAWPDQRRSALDEWFLNFEIDGTWEYGVNAVGGGTISHGFKKRDAHWLLPLCRAVCFQESENILQAPSDVHDCAETFFDVPLTNIEFTGGMNPLVFATFLGWALSKPLIILTSRDYSTQRSSVSNLSDHLRQRLADFKAQHRLA